MDKRKVLAIVFYEHISILTIYSEYMCMYIQRSKYASISFHKKALSTLSTHCVLSVDQACLWKLILGYNNVEQSMENSVGPVHDLSLRASGALANF